MRMNLKAERVRIGYTQSQFAALLDVSEPTLIRYEKGQSMPIEKVIKASEICGCTTDYLLGLTEERIAH